MSQENRHGFELHAGLQQIDRERVSEPVRVALDARELKDFCQTPLPIGYRRFFEAVPDQKKYFPRVFSSSNSSAAFLGSGSHTGCPVFWV